MNIIVMMGPPGSGKGTYSEILADKYGYTHISMGQMLRERAKIDDALGREVKHWMARNVLLPDRLVRPVLEERLRQVPDNATVILDGYPRTEEQRRALDKMIDDGGYTLQAVIALQVSDEVVIKRILGRGRNKLDSDRNEILKRLFDYSRDTVPVISHYEARNSVTKVRGEGTIEESMSRVEDALGLNSADLGQNPDFQP